MGKNMLKLDVKGFDEYIASYKAAIKAQKDMVEALPL